MPLSQIKVKTFRNLGSVELAPSPRLNILFGSNGSGKTSLLEAVSVLAHGRSFRTRKYRRLIQELENQFVVFGQMIGGAGRQVNIGVARTRTGDNRIRVDGSSVTSSAELAAHLPLLVLNGEAFELLGGAPIQRRQFFDWLVFHVKPEFRAGWRDYTRCVKHRNSLLRHDKISYSEIRPWDLEIGRLSRDIESARIACIEPLVEQFTRLTADLPSAIGGDELDLSYLSGWKTDIAYEDQLKESYLRDRKVGYTTLGPHKSDFKVLVRGTPASEILSRGQQKTVISALYVAAARTHAVQVPDAECVIAIDDMPAELDPANIERVASWLNQTQGQLFVTAVDYRSLTGTWPDLEEQTLKLFHVKQGEITEFIEDAKDASRLT